MQVKQCTVYQFTELLNCRSTNIVAQLLFIQSSLETIGECTLQVISDVLHTFPLDLYTEVKVTKCRVNFAMNFGPSINGFRNKKKEKKICYKSNFLKVTSVSTSIQ